MENDNNKFPKDNLEQKRDVRMKESKQEEVLYWYAAKALYNRQVSIIEELQKAGNKIFNNKLASSLVFIKCTENEILRIKQVYWSRMFIYMNAEKAKPYAIPEDQMNTFIYITTMDPDGASYLGDDKAEYHQGERVRVKEGPFKGMEGHIKRIKKDRRVIVSINGIAAIALAHIPLQFLEKV